MVEYAPLVIGAGIGYCTNWFAIKMLFRPYNEVKVLGVKLPFTPGLIPKERKRIARQIGITVGDYLLTEEMVKRELLNEDTINHVETMVETFLTNNFSGQKTVCDVLHDFGLEEKDLQAIYHYATKSIMNLIMSEDVQKKLLEQIKKIEDIKDNLLDMLLTSSQNKTIREIVGDEGIDNIKTIAFKNLPNMLKWFEEQLDSPVLKEKGTEALNNVVQEKLGGLGAMFVSVEGIYDTGILRFKESLQQPDTIELIVDKIKEIIDELAQKNLDDIGDETQLQSFLDHFLTKLFNSFNQEEILLRLNELIKNQEASINDFVGQQIKKISSDVLNQPIRISRAVIEKIKFGAKNKYQGAVTTYGKTFIKSFNIAQLVEREINNFEIKELESMILDIAKKELNAITWFGALLGFILGGIQLLMH